MRGYEAVIPHHWTKRRDVHSVYQEIRPCACDCPGDYVRADDLRLRASGHQPGLPLVASFLGSVHESGAACVSCRGFHYLQPFVCGKTACSHKSIPTSWLHPYRGPETNNLHRSVVAAHVNLMLGVARPDRPALIPAAASAGHSMGGRVHSVHCLNNLRFAKGPEADCLTAHSHGESELRSTSSRNMKMLYEAGTPTTLRCH